MTLAAGTRPPMVAGWSLTKRCNLRCMHCYSGAGIKAKDELTTQQAFAVADKLVNAGVAAVNFGGGECALRQDFIPLCAHLKEHGIKISYTTNGTVHALIKPHLALFSDIGVSIDFADEGRHDAFRGVLGTYKKAVATLRDLVREGVDTEIVTCLTRKNASEEELGRLYALAKETGVDYWRLNRFRETGRGLINNAELALTPAMLKDAYAFLAKKIPEGTRIPEPLFRAAYGGAYAIAGDPSGSTAFRIQPDGEVTPSVFLKVSGGNIVTDSLEGILASPIFTQIRDRTPQGKCVSCPSYAHCRGGDAGASFLAYGHFDGPDPLCWLEPQDAHPEAIQALSEQWNVHEMYLCTLYVPMRPASAEA